MGERSNLPKRAVAIGGAVLVAVILGSLAMRKPSEPPVASADTAASSATATGAAGNAVAIAESHLATMPPAAIPTPPPAAPPISMPTATVAAPAAMTAPELSDGADDEESDKPKKAKRVRVPPFGNGPVAHGNLLHLRMDGPIEAIQGAAQPTGFTVKLPNRKSLEAAGPLAARDARIASIKVTNDGAGAELTVAFNNGVPNYQVRARNETLEIALAPLGKAHVEHHEGRRRTASRRRSPRRSTPTRATSTAISATTRAEVASTRRSPHRGVARRGARAGRLSVSSVAASPRSCARVSARLRDERAIRVNPRLAPKRRQGKASEASRGASDFRPAPCRRRGTW